MVHTKILFVLVENDSLSLMRIARDQENHELNVQHRSRSPSSSNTPRKTTKTALESKLEHLEKKQYELTKKVCRFYFIN
jgi:hypothetical protein